MPFYIVQAGTKLYRVSSAGVCTELTLPDGITLVSTRKPRMAILKENIFIANTPTRNLWVDPDGTVRPMSIQAPQGRPRLSAGSSTGLTGSYRAKVSFLIKDDDGRVLCESPLSEPSAASASLTDDDLKAEDIPLSADSRVNARRLYRTTSGPGELYYPWVDLDDNRQTSVADGLSDAGLELLPELGGLGVPPGSAAGSRLKLLTAWGERLWGIGADRPDYLLFSEAGVFYGWPAANEYPVKPVGQDAEGVTAFIARRDELGICKRDKISKLTGSSTDDYQINTVVEGTGCVSQDTVVVVRDEGIFLAEDGVYSFGPNGITPLSRGRVHPWFTTDTYFNRSRFENAWAEWNPRLDTYDLHLAAAGSSNEDRWVSLHLSGPYKGAWTGPHKTGAFTPSHGALLEDASDQAMPVIGGTDGFIYKANQSTFTDGASTAIDFDVTLAWLSAKTPDVEKVWKQLSILSGVESAGTLDVTPTVGGLDAAAGSTMSFTLTLGRERGARLGTGRFVKLRLRQNTNAVGCKIYGIEIPYVERGRR